MASELDSIWLAPTKEVALAQMNAIRGFSKPELDASFDEAWEVYRTHPDRAVPNTAEEQIAYGRTFQSFAEFATGITKKDVKHPATSIRAVTPELCEVWCALPGALKKRAARKMDGARIPVRDCRLAIYLIVAILCQEASSLFSICQQPVSPVSVLHQAMSSVPSPLKSPTPASCHSDVTALRIDHELK